MVHSPPVADLDPEANKSKTTIVKQLSRNRTKERSLVQLPSIEKEPADLAQKQSMQQQLSIQNMGQQSSVTIISS